MVGDHRTENLSALSVNGKVLCLTLAVMIGVGLASAQVARRIWQKNDRYRGIMVICDSRTGMETFAVLSRS